MLIVPVPVSWVVDAQSDWVVSVPPPVPKSIVPVPRSSTLVVRATVTDPPSVILSVPVVPVPEPTKTSPLVFNFDPVPLTLTRPVAWTSLLMPEL